MISNILRRAIQLIGPRSTTCEHSIFYFLTTHYFQCWFIVILNITLVKKQNTPNNVVWEALQSTNSHLFKMRNFHFQKSETLS